MLLAINANNTSSVFGLYDSSADLLIRAWRVSTRRDRTPDEWFALLVTLFRSSEHQITDVDAVIVGSVVPSVTTWLRAMAMQRLSIEPIIVSAALDLGFRALVDQPEDVGPDRLANTVAAFERHGGPAIVVDFGTATNFDVISADGDFLGGAIAPGLTVSLEALTSRAARLFSVDLVLPARAVGTSTVTNIQSGTVLGHLAMVEGMLARMQSEVGGGATVIATGGNAPIFAANTAAIHHYAPDLTIDGLNLIYQRLVPMPE